MCVVHKVMGLAEQGFGGLHRVADGWAWVVVMVV